MRDWEPPSVYKQHELQANGCPPPWREEGPARSSASATVPLRVCDHVRIDHACRAGQALDRCVLGDGHWSPKAGLRTAKSIWSQMKSSPSPVWPCLPPPEAGLPAAWPWLRGPRRLVGAQHPASLTFSAVNGM